MSQRRERRLGLLSRKRGPQPNTGCGVAGSEQRGYCLIMNNVVSRDREILGGTPVFAGTRVPVRNLIDCLEGGYTIDEFLEDFPTVSRDQVIAFLENTKAELELAVPA